MSGAAVGQALREAQHSIDAVDARILLRHVVGRGAAWLAAHPEALLESAEVSAYLALVARRARGEPVAYLTGEREFYGRPFRVTPAVLIPRPETELLVEVALERLPRESSARVLDLGTGSGCVAVTIAAECAYAQVVAVDRSAAALAVARGNCERLGLANVDFIESDWFAALGGERFSVIVANPPYVAAGDPHLGRGDLRYEPRAALEAGVDGLECIRTIASDAARYLEPGGWLAFEHGHDQAARTRALLEAGGYAEIISVRDLAGIERVSVGRLTGPPAPR